MIAVGERLAAQNNGAAWIDCTLRRNPRGHRFVVDASTDTAVYWQCRRCKVGTRTLRPFRVAPDPWLGRRPERGMPADYVDGDRGGVGPGYRKGPV